MKNFKHMLVGVFILCGSLHDTLAQGGMIYRITTNLLGMAAGATAAITVNPEALYRRIDQTIRRIEGKNDESIDVSTDKTRIKFAQFEQRFNAKYSPITLDKTSRVGIGFVTYMLAMKVLHFLG